jgi:outer membrane biosynthesis protein TonB
VLVKWSRWRDRLKSNSILRCLLISLALHLAAFTTIEMGGRAGLWKFRLLAKPNRERLVPNDPNKQQEQKIVLQFIEVDPAQPVEEPKDAKFYSNANSQAANPDPKRDTPIPKIDGTQTKVPQVRDLAKAEPTPPPQPKQDTMQPAVKPSQAAAPTKPEEPVGDTKENTLTPEEKAKRDVTMDRPQPKTTPTQPRPRTLAEARQNKGVPEPKMKQDGGVRRYSLGISPAAKMTPFGSYDAAFIAAVRKRWYDILDSRQYPADQTGHVALDFRLYPDGRVLQMNVAESDVSDTLSWACQRAILDPAPYAPFPPDLKRLLGKEYREIHFTFYYGLGDF